MTWLEMAKKKGYTDNISDFFCPQYVYNNGLHYDKETAVSSIDGITGCRGITCKECWAQEAKDE